MLHRVTSSTIYESKKVKVKRIIRKDPLQYCLFGVLIINSDFKIKLALALAMLSISNADGFLAFYQSMAPKF